MDLQVTTRGGRTVLGGAKIHLAGGEFADVAIPFAVTAPASIEYRAGWDGQGWAAVDAVTAAFADEPDPGFLFEVERLAHELQERPDPHASGGFAGHATPGRTVRDEVWSGPLRRYPPGRYRLWVRLKLDQSTPAAFARCGVRPASSGPELAGQELSGSEVPEPGRYVELAVPFAVARAAVLEFPAHFAVAWASGSTGSGSSASRARREVGGADGGGGLSRRRARRLPAPSPPSSRRDCRSGRVSWPSCRF